MIGGHFLKNKNLAVIAILSSIVLISTNKIRRSINTYDYIVCKDNQCINADHILEKDRCVYAYTNTEDQSFNEYKVICDDYSVKKIKVENINNYKK